MLVYKLSQCTMNNNSILVYSYLDLDEKQCKFVYLNSAYSSESNFLQGDGELSEDE